MAAKLLHSLTDDNPDLQKQIGCMTGIFQLFDRHQIFTGRHIVGHSLKRLPPGNSHFNNSTLERESNNSHQRSVVVDKHPNKNTQERQKVSTESSRASFSSSSRSSSFSSLDCNQTTQLEPSSFDRIIFPETPSRDPAMSPQTSSSHLGRQIDLRDVVKDSMYRELQGSSAKAKTIEEAADPVLKYRDSPRPLPKLSDSSHGSGLSRNQNLPDDLKESLRVLAKLREAPWYQNEPREILRTYSYNSKDGSAFSVSKDVPRFSYDGRETNHTPFESRDISKSTIKLKDLPRLSLDSREGSMLNLNADSKSNFFSKTWQIDDGEFDDKVRNPQQTSGNQARPPSVVAKLMGLEALPDTVSASETNMGSSRIHPGEDAVNILRSCLKTDACKPVRLSSSSMSLRKETTSPRWRNPNTVMKPMSLFPIEPASWKQIDGIRSSQKPGSTNMGGPPKVPNTFPSVYSKAEKRLKDLEFTQSGKDLRALKQILEAMQAKGLLETQDIGQYSSFTSHKNHEHKYTSSIHDASANNQKPQPDKFLASTKKGKSLRNFESPIVLMKPAKLVKKTDTPASSVISLDGLSGLQKLRGIEFVDNNRKGLSHGRTATKDQISKTSPQDNAVNSVNIREESRILRTTQTTRSQQLPKESSAGSGKSSGSNSPRTTQKKLDLEKRSRPPTPPDSGKSTRQSNKQQQESSSPGGKRRPKHPILQQSDDQLSKVSGESRNFSFPENEISVHSNESTILHSKNVKVTSSERSPGIISSQSPSMKAAEILVSGIVEKKSPLMVSEEESAEFASVPPEYPSPVSVLDNSVYTDDSTSPVKHVGKTLKGDGSTDSNRVLNTVQGSSADDVVPNSMGSGITSEINRKKLENIENLVQKLRRLNSSHDEARIDYIASLCENTDPDHRYISEILLASGLLLRDLSSSLATFQFHQSGHPINPELFLVLEQTKASTLLSTEKTSQLMTKEKFHRKLIFDAANELLSRKLTASGNISEPWLRPNKLARRALNAQKLLRELCSEIDKLQAKSLKYNIDDEDDGLKNILCQDVMHESESWINFYGDNSGVVLEVERLIFKDLVDEIVIGKAGGSKTKPLRPRQLFAK